MSITSFVPPRIGNWFRRSDHPQAFHVIALDESSATVDVEYFDGTLDEWPLRHWQELSITPCDAPQDWSGPFDSPAVDEAPDDEDDSGSRHCERQIGERLEQFSRTVPDLDTDFP